MKRHERTVREKRDSGSIGEGQGDDDDPFILLMGPFPLVHVFTIKSLILSDALSRSEDFMVQTPRCSPKHIDLIFHEGTKL